MIRNKKAIFQLLYRSKSQAGDLGKSVATLGKSRARNQIVSKAVSPEAKDPSEKRSLAIEKDPEDWEHVSESQDLNLEIKRMLEPGESVLEIQNAITINFGLNVKECMVLECTKHLYIIDNFYKSATGEIFNVNDIEEQERNVFARTMMNRDKKKSYDHYIRKCPINEIKDVFKRTFMLQKNAIELFLNDGRNFLLAFSKNRDRDSLYNRLYKRIISKSEESFTQINANLLISAPGLVKNVLGINRNLEMTQKWVDNEISNFAYLMYLNSLAGRTYNDLTQYPVFPWIIADYRSENLDLNNPKTFRDLSKPMGAQGGKRAEAFSERFDCWDDPVMPACHYGTHYSSAMIVCAYLIRLEPFTEQYLQLQGGNFDHADRLFHSIETAYFSAAELNTTDVKELIPEFFFLPDFLENKNGLNFGMKQNGEVLDNVKLPPWAKGDPRIFIKKHRDALESPFVSARLNEWIDLIFGYKQLGEEAAKALNVFHYLSYEGAVELDKISDHVELEATIGIINNFGQTPQQLFKKPHPKRNSQAQMIEYIHEKPTLLTRTTKPVKIGEERISDIKISGDKLVTAPLCSAISPNGLRYLSWNYWDRSIRLFLCESRKVLAIFENLHVSHVSDCTWVDNDTFLTAGSDFVSLYLSQILRCFLIG
jgi:hypothetical protein